MPKITEIRIIMGTLVHNKSFNRSFQVLEEMEAGLVLTGPEVKSLKSGHADLKGAFISIKNGKATLKKMYIAPYQKASKTLASYNPERERALLLHRKEMLYLANKTDSKGLTIVPVSVYTTRRLIKVKIALVKGKKQFDKRQDIKKREMDRSIAQHLKN